LSVGMMSSGYRWRMRKAYARPPPQGVQQP
jgi:hypothetical protein